MGTPGTIAARKKRNARALAAAVGLAAAAALAAPLDQEAVARLPRAERARLERLAALSPAALDTAAGAMNPAALQSLAAALADPLGAPSRDRLLEHLRRLEPNGVELLGSFRIPLAVPAPLDGQPARLTAGGRAWPLLPLWPNGAMPALCPAGGLSGQLVDAGAGEWADLEGLDLTNAIALLSFRGGRNWIRLFSLGCQAVVVCGDDFISRENAEGLFCNTPLPCPRFYADAEQAAALRALAARAEPARLEGGHVYANRTAESLFAYLPPAPPLRLRLREGETPAALARDFGVTEAALRAANPGLPPDPAAGTGVVVPNLEGAQLVAVRLDAVSVVPDAPRGGKVSGSAAAALAALEHLAAAPGMVRRRGGVFAFLDGDNHGGAASRAFAETALRLAGRLNAAPGSAVRPGAGAEAAALERKARLRAFLAGGAPPEGPEARQAEEWLRTRLEARRVELAEARIGALDRGEIPAREALERDIALLAALRNATLDNPALGAAARLEAFRKATTDPEALPGLVRLGLDFSAFLARFDPELEEERQALDRRTGNEALVRRVLERLHPAGAPRSATGWLWDLSDGSASLGVAGTDARELAGASDAERQALGERLMETAAFAAGRAGWPEAFTFVGGASRARFAAMRVDRGPSYSEFWTAARVGLVPLVTLNDRQPRLDTPRDTLDRVDFTNLAVQARTALVLLRTALESPSRGALSAPVRTPAFGRVTGRVLQFNIRSGIDAQEPVPGAWIHCPAHPLASRPNSATIAGTRLGTVQISGLDGAYAMPLEALAFKGAFRLFAFRLDPRTALFDRMLDAGQTGSQRQSPAFQLLADQEVEKNLILTPGYPFAILPGVDPVDYGAEAAVSLQDVALNGAPPHYGLVSDLADFTESGVGAHLAFCPPGRRIRLVLERGARPVGLLTGEAPADPKAPGRGRRVGPGPEGRNVALPLTPLALARDMQALALRRQALYRAFGVRSAALDDALALSGRLLAEAEAHAAAREWQAAVGKAREAWGITARNYPGLMALGREAVFSVILLMALLIPGCLFLESLLLGARGVAGRLAGAAALFGAGVLFLNSFHPAFRIAVSPFIVLIAFTMILAASLVLGLSYQRFDVLVRRARIEGGEAESEEIGLADSLATAFALGVSNLRKRKARTALTVFTVSALTFSIIAFVSVRGRDAMASRPLGYDTGIEDRVYAAGELVPPAYTGLLFRAFIWGDIEAMVPDLRTEYGHDHEVAARGFYVEVEGGNNADREGVNQIEVVRDGRTAILNALMTFEPAETNFTALHRAVTRGQWFQPAGSAPAFADRFTVILPAPAAEALGIAERDLFDEAGLRPPEALPTVAMMGRRWRVVGILDPERADRIRDVNGESPAMVDHLRSAITPSQGSGKLENEPDFVHLSWRRLGLIPLEAGRDVGAKTKSFAVRFRPGEDGEAFLAAAAARLNAPLLGNVRGGPELLTSRTAFTVAGAAKVVLPVILCILIVANTMLGAVEERKGEVRMLGAVGLSPAQIAFLLLAESTVYSVTGILFGAFAGLLFSRTAPAFPSLFGLLSFNFTSLASTALALGAGGVVLLATLLPARRAAALAAPSGMEKWRLPAPGPGGRIDLALPFTLTRGNAVGMLAFFRRFLLNHAEATGPGFNCRDVRVFLEREPGDRIGLRCRMWLAPYDLDAAQELELRIEPAGGGGVCSVGLALVRFSGTEEAWLRTNAGFLEQVRLQFLLWRNLEAGLRRRYIDEGAGLLAAAEGTGP